MELYVVLIGLGILIGFVTNHFIIKYRQKKQIENSKLESERILEIAKKEAENIKNNKIIQAKEKFLELKSEHEKTILSREDKIKNIERQAFEKEKEISVKLSLQSDLNIELKSKSDDFDKKLKVLEKKNVEVEKKRKEQIKQLEIIARLSEEEAKNQLVNSIKKDAEADALVYVKEKMEEAKMSVQKDAKK